MLKKALLIIHTFPPYAFAESYLSAKKMGNIPGVEVDVLTISPFMTGVREDKEFLSYVQKRFRKIMYLHPPRWYHHLPFTRLEALFSIPDPYLYLNPFYFKYLKNISHYDMFITWSTYNSAHLLGLYAKKRNPAVPWIAHFSDPWVNNPYSKQNNFVKSINKYWENKVFTRADSLMFTSEETKELVLKSYPNAYHEKSYVIPHAFDEVLYCYKKKPSNKKFLIRYIGNFYGSRQPCFFVNALEIIHKQTPEKIKKLKIEFIGSISKNNSHEIPEALKDIIEFKEPVNYLESLKLMKEAHLLLVIDSPFEMSPFLPSKLVDYVGANKPIFGITPPGTSQKLIEEMGFLVAHPHNPKDIANKLIKMIDRFHLNEKDVIVPKIWRRYTTAIVGKKMVEVIENTNNKNVL